MSVFIGLDIGGTKFLVGAADGEGHILRRTRAATSTDLNQDLETLHRMIADVTQGEKIGGMGAAIGGPLTGNGALYPPASARLAGWASQTNHGGTLAVSLPGGCGYQYCSLGEYTAGAVTARRSCTSPSAPAWAED